MASTCLCKASSSTGRLTLASMTQQKVGFIRSRHKADCPLILTSRAMTRLSNIRDRAKAENHNYFAKIIIVIINQNILI